MLTLTAQCWLCQQPLYHSHHGICSHCRRHLQAAPISCPRCGLPCASATLVCGRCLQQPPPWHTLLFVSDYQPPLSSLIKQLKYQRRTELASILARLLVLRWRERRRETVLALPQAYPRPDAIVAVPLHRWRQWRRGFNQTDLLARYLAHALDCAYYPAALGRMRATAAQHTLDARARQRNLHGAFQCQMDMRGKHIVLLDDVVTTGSTVAHLSRLLIAAGALQVQVWCLCRTLS